MAGTRSRGTTMAASTREHVASDPEALERPAERRAAALMALGCGLLVAAMAMSRTVVENDVFWHLAIGRYVLEHGLPFTDPFGVGTDGLPWSPPEWLAELAMFTVHQRAGWAGLAALHGLLLVALGALVALRARTLGARWGHTLIAIALLAIPASLHLPMRPLVLGHLFSALVLWMLARDRRGERSGVAWLPLAFALWANLHPSWPLGLGWLGMDLALRWMSGPLSRRFPDRFVATRPSRALVIALVLSPVAVFLRPDGLDGALYPFVHVIGLGDQMREIIEWFPLSPTRPLHATALALGALTAGLCLRRQRLDPVELGIAAVSLVLMVRYQRFVPLALIGWAPLLASALPSITATARSLAVVETTKGAALIAAALAALAALAFPSPALLEQSVTLGFPVAATDALIAIDEARERVGRPALSVFTTFEDGGYVLYRRGRGRVYLDSRFDLYARAGIFAEYLSLRRGEPALPIFAAREMDAAIVPTAARDDHFAALLGEAKRTDTDAASPTSKPCSWSATSRPEPPARAASCCGRAPTWRRDSALP